MRNELIQSENKLQRSFYLFLVFTFFISCLLMFPFCRTNIIKLAESVLHKSLNYEFWHTIILYALITISSFSFYWLSSSFLNHYTKSDKFSLKQTMIVISLLLFVVSFLTQTVLLYDGIVYGADDPAYVAIAEAIANKTYNADFVQMQTPSIGLQYTVGYPGLIAIAIKIFGLNFYAIKLVNVFLYSISVVVLFNLLFLLLKDIKIALSVSSLFCLNFIISNWQNRTMSDTTCMAFSLFCLALIYNIFFCESQKKYFKAILLGICFFFAYECRMNGLVCLLTFLSIQLLICMRKLISLKFFENLTINYIKTNWKIHLLPYIVFVFLLCLQKIVYPDLPRQDSYLLANLSLKCFFQHFRYFYIMYEFFNSAWNYVFHQFNILSKITFYSSLLLALYGIVKNWKDLPLFLIFSIGNVIIYCIWDSFQGIRFYFPLFIPLAVFCAYGAKSIKDVCHSEKAIILPTIVGKFSVLLFCAMFTVSVFPIYTRNFKDTIKANGHSYSVEAQDMWTYINKNIPDDKTFIFRSARELYLYTKHLTVTPDQKADFYLHNFEKPIDTELKNLLSDEAVSGNQIELNGQLFILEYSNDKFKLFHALQ